MRLNLVWRDRPTPREHHPLAVKTPRQFLDFVVDGRSLFDVVRERYDFIGCLGWLDAEYDDEAAAALLLDKAGEFEGRVGLYICPECADANCGAVTAVIEHDGDGIIWRDLAATYPNFTIEGEPEPESAWNLARDAFADLKPMRFPRTAYREAI
jgi:hypothetical protein